MRLLLDRPLHRRADRRAGGADPDRQLIGVWWTIALLVADAILGSLLARSQGRSVWRRFNEALQAGRPPAREVMDGALVLFGGALLLTPGFLTDILGVFLLLPPTRALVRAVLVRRFAGRMVASMARAARPPARAGRGARQSYDVEGTAVDSPPDGLTRAPPPGARRRDRRRAGAGPDADGSGVRGRGDVRVRRRGGAGLRARPDRALPRRRGRGPQGSALAVLFAGREPVAAIARGGLEVAGDAGWDAICARRACDDGRRAAARAGTWRWRASGTGFELRFEALTPPAEIAGEDPLAAGGRDGRLRAAVRGHRRRARRRAADRGPLPRPARARLGRARLGAHRGSRARSRAWPGAGHGARAHEPCARAARAHAEEPSGPRCSTTRARLRVDDPRAVDDLRRRRPPAPRRPRAVGRRRRVPAARLGRGRSAARRSTSARCAWTARSSAGGSRARPASAATTCCGARSAAG